MDKPGNRRKSALSNKTAYPVVDLFAGPGGLGEGFCSMIYPSPRDRYAFRSAVSIENDVYACSTLRLRHFYREFPPGEVPDEYYDYLADMISLEDIHAKYPKEFRSADNAVWECTLGAEPQENVKKRISSSLSGTDKWVLLGGPPCQAYSLVGRARMRGNPDFDTDKRHFLYRDYVRVIADHRPPVFVMENVKGLISSKTHGKRLIDDILKALAAPHEYIYGNNSGVKYRLYSLSEPGRKGEDADPSSFLVKAEEYGIPQARHRIFIVGIREDIDAEPAVLSKAPSATVKETIGDMPAVRSGLSRSEDSHEAWRKRLEGLLRQPSFAGAHANGLAGLVEEAKNVLRSENIRYGMERSSREYLPLPRRIRFYDPRLKALLSHETRSHKDDDIQRYFFAALYSRVNGASPRLSDFPDDLLPDHRNVDEGKRGGKFSDRFRVQLPDSPSRTVTSHLSKDGHAFIHYDPSQSRSMTVREVARLQTFPDNYKFQGSRTAQYRQVGNAVPPMLAEKIAEAVYEILEGMK